MKTAWWQTMYCKSLQSMLKITFFVIIHQQRYFGLLLFNHVHYLSLQILLKPEKMAAIMHQFLPNGQVGCHSVQCCQYIICTHDF